MSSTWLHPNSFSRSLHKARICCTLHRALLFYNKTWTNRFYFPAFSWRHTFSAGVFSGSLLPTAAAEGWLFPQNWQTAWTNSFKLSFLTCFLAFKIGFLCERRICWGLRRVSNSSEPGTSSCPIFCHWHSLKELGTNGSGIFVQTSWAHI